MKYHIYILLLLELSSISLVFSKELNSNSNEPTQIKKFANINTLMIEAPKLISPLNKSLNINPETTFFWEPASGADYYHLQISNDSDFAVIIVNKSNITNTDCQINQFDFYTIYYWRVRSVSIDGTSDWSEVWQFKTKLIPPELKLPPNQKLGEITFPDLTWKAYLNITGSIIQIATEQSFSQSSMIYSGESEELQRQRIALSYNIKYFWRVRVVTDDSESDWSEIWSFTTQLEIPILIEPDNNIKNLPLEVVLSWNTCDGADLYSIEIASDSELSNVIYSESVTKNKKDVSNWMEYNKKYFWRIQAKTVKNNFSNWSENRNYSTMPEPMDIPKLRFPDSSSVDVGIDFNYSWFTYEKADSFLIQTAIDENFEQIINEKNVIKSTFCKSENLEYQTTYFWRVKAFVDGRESPWSNVWEFKTKQMILSTPVLITPKDNLNGQDISLLFGWNKVENSDYYRLHIATDFLFNNIIRNYEDLMDTFKLVNGLDYLNEYYWRVHAYNSSTESQWSESFKFETMDDPTGVSDISGNGLNFSVRPQPVEDFVAIVINSNYETSGKINIINSIGISIYKNEQLHVINGENKLSFNLSNFASGIYIIIAEINNRLFFKKIIKK